jgi:hypothetical protein
MLKSIVTLTLVTALLAGAGWVAYDYYRAGLHTLPPIPDGAFWLSYKNGLRAIILDRPDHRPERKYLGVPVEVPGWYRDVWSFCTEPNAKERAAAPIMGPGARLEAVCRIEVEKGKHIVRGMIFSVPRKFTAPQEANLQN